MTWTFLLEWGVQHPGHQPHNPPPVAPCLGGGGGGGGGLQPEQWKLVMTMITLYHHTKGNDLKQTILPRKRIFGEYTYKYN